MRQVLFATGVFAVACAGVVLHSTTRGQSTTHGNVKTSGADAGNATGADLPTRLDFVDLIESGPKLTPSHRALALAGHRVRMVGFMAQMELPPTGGFYLTPRPVRCDEAGGGTADLPPDSVFVVSRSARDKEVPFIAGALEMTGAWDVGNRADQDGRVSAFRLELDDVQPRDSNAAQTAMGLYP